MAAQFKPTPTPVALAVAMVCGAHMRQNRAHAGMRTYALTIRSYRYAYGR